MYNLTLTAEQLEFRDTIRDFVEREIKPVATHSSRLQPLHPPFPADLLALAAPLGLRTLMLTEEHGGANADTLTACIVMEELAAGDVDVAMAMAHTAFLAHALFEGAMNTEQRARLLPAFTNDEHGHLAYAGTDTGGPGWQYHRNRAAPAARVTAVRNGGHWILNGDAGFVANAPIAGLIAVEASAGVLIATRGAPGLTVRVPGTDSESVIPWIIGSGGYVTFKDCSVPVDNFIAAPQTLRRTQGHSVALTAAVNLGLGRTAFEAAIAYAKLRVQGGRPIIQHQAIGTKLAGIAISLEAARNLIWKAAWALDHPESAASLPTLPLETAARVFTAETVCEATEKAAECFGAMGVMRDMPLQKYVHDAVKFLHANVSSAVDMFEIGEAVAGFESSAA
ncbi:MAG: acyl-CoA dehydrogenase family protein [Burkholderiales bacterium]